MIQDALETASNEDDPPTMPPWARRRETVESLSDQAFVAGAAVGVIDHLVRSNPPWLGVLAARLALHAAAVSCRHLGRGEDEQALRDLWVMRSASIAPGPPGRVLMAWQRLGRHDALSELGLVTAAGHLGLSEGFAGGDLADEIQTLATTAGPLNAAEAAAAAIARAGHRDPPGELLALWVANAVLGAAPALARGASADRLRDAAGRREPPPCRGPGMGQGAGARTDRRVGHGRTIWRQSSAPGGASSCGCAKTAHQRGAQRCRGAACARTPLRPAKRTASCRIGRAAPVRSSGGARRRPGTVGASDLPPLWPLTMARRKEISKKLDKFERELAELPPEVRWREWMGRVEAMIFASPEPVSREVLTRVVGQECNIDLLIEDIRVELADRPYELVAVAGGWQHRTRPRFAAAIHASSVVPEKTSALSEHQRLVLMAIGYFQPVTRGELGRIFGREISRDTIGALSAEGLIGAGARSPQPGAPYTYVTTQSFLTRFGFNSLRDLPDFEKLEDAGLLSKQALLRHGTDVLGAVLGDEDDESVLGEAMDVKGRVAGCAEDKR